MKVQVVDFQLCVPPPVHVLVHVHGHDRHQACLAIIRDTEHIQSMNGKRISMKHISTSRNIL